MMARSGALIDMNQDLGESVRTPSRSITIDRASPMQTLPYPALFVGKSVRDRLLEAGAELRVVGVAVAGHAKGRALDHEDVGDAARRVDPQVRAERAAVAV